MGVLSRASWASFRQKLALWDLKLYCKSGVGLMERISPAKQIWLGSTWTRVRSNIPPRRCIIRIKTWACPRRLLPIRVLWTTRWGTTFSKCEDTLSRRIRWWTRTISMEPAAGRRQGATTGAGTFTATTSRPSQRWLRPSSRSTATASWTEELTTQASACRTKRPII